MPINKNLLLIFIYGVSFSSNLRHYFKFSLKTNRLVNRLLVRLVAISGGGLGIRSVVLSGIINTYITMSEVTRFKGASCLVLSISCHSITLMNYI
jgi:hypothetical protein